MKLRGFVIYAHEDVEVKTELLNQLAGVDEIEGVWHDTMISPGSKWPEEIAWNLRESDIVILLVSSNFYASSFIQSIELALALSLAARNRVRLLPVRVEDAVVPAKIAVFQWLPSDPHQPDYISGWGKRSDALANVAKGVQAACRERIAQIKYDRIRRNWFALAFAMTATLAILAHRQIEARLPGIEIWSLEILAFPITLALIYSAGMLLFRSFRSSPRRDMFVGVAPQFELSKFLLGAGVLMALWGAIGSIIDSPLHAQWLCRTFGVNPSYEPDAHAILQYAFPWAFAATAFYSGAVLRSRQQDLLPPPFAPESEADLLWKAASNGLVISALCAFAVFLGYGKELSTFGEATDYHTFVMFQTGWGFARGFIPRLPL